MENNQINNNFSVEKRYNPLKDASFWIAFVLSGGPAIFLLIGRGFIFETPVIASIIMLVIWEAWIIFKKGKKWSLIVGFFIAAVFAGVTLYVMTNNEMNNQTKQMDEARQKAMQQIQEQLKNQYNSPQK